MATERKREQVALLEERLGRASVAIGLDYRGLSVGEMQAMRRAIRAEAPETELRVVKNTLLARAAENAGLGEAAQLANEATALLLGYGELTEAPRALRAYTRSASREIPIHGVFFEGRFAPGETVAELASIPSRPELMAKVAGGLSSPITGIASALNAVFRDMAALIEARAEQLEQGGQGDQGGQQGDPQGAEGEQTEQAAG